MKKLIFVLLDGLTRKGAKDNMGYLWHMVESQNACYIDIKGELPSLSRPCYETIFTGMPVYEHGITSNNITRNSTFQNIFSLAKKSNLTTGAAAYHWISELYNISPFVPAFHRQLHEDSLSIQHGIYYFEDNYPDTHLFLDGEFLRKQYNLDFLLIHPMGLDFIGHSYGCNSKEYELKLVEMDSMLANLIPLWINENYSVIVTSDHGMSELGNHGGNNELLRNLPLFLFNAGLKTEDREYSQLSIAPTICQILGIEPSTSMKYEPIKLI
ncbi:alkaline phosphatase family protein [Clostridium sp. DJ247]|uniref:alkaline phosphatase family protein n=1 Tax=Clostridium sp. DJ247 TaxID=2726188 RepID=UPI001629558A|nr:alkaline phosphatase family protein [Clostridium sp. DJ247]MBC2579438.1 alkaline phosphatase family protein [Clostridium sp. DJ247]